MVIADSLPLLCSFGDKFLEFDKAATRLSEAPVTTVFEIDSCNLTHARGPSGGGFEYGADLERLLKSVVIQGEVGIGL
jgi:hypothetical protein